MQAQAIHVRRSHITRLVLTALICFGGALSLGTGHATLATQNACALSGDFDGAELRPFYVQGPGLALSADTGYNSPKSAKISIAGQGTYPWSLQFVHENVALTAGKRYQLSFWVKASQTRTTDVLLQQFDSPYTVVWRQAFDMSTAWQRVNITFDYPEAAVTPRPAFRINLGQATGDVWIDGLALCESNTQPVPPTPQPVSTNCRVVNGHFESGTNNWQFAAQTPAQATLSTDTGARSATAAKVSIRTGAAAPGGITLSQSGLNIPAGIMSLAFFGKSNAGQTLNIALDSNGASLWQGSVRLPDPARDSAFKQFFLAVPVQTASANARLSFNLGQNSGDVWIDGVQICNLPLKFADDFNGAALDATKWKHCVAFSRDCTVEINGGVEWYKEGNVEVSNGTMKQRFTREPNQVCVGCAYGPGKMVDREFASAYLQTSETFNTQYGYFEARIKMPSTKGTWPAFWLLPSKQNDQIYWPPEIDVVEHYPTQPELSWHTIHYKTAAVYHNTDGKQYQHPVSLNQGFHVYSANWTPTEVVFYVDGMETYRTSAATINQSMFMIVSLGAGALAGAPEADLSGGTMEVDYVRVFNNAEAFGFDGGTQQPPVATQQPPAATQTPQPPQPTLDMNSLTKRTYLPVTRRGR